MTTIYRMPAPPPPPPAAVAKRRYSDQEAAAKIQAGFRGFKVRKQNQSAPKKQIKEEEVDIDLKDPEVNKAALLIQDRTKNMTGLKTLRAKKAAKAEEASVGSSAHASSSKQKISQNLKKSSLKKTPSALKAAMEEDKAAVKIQAQFKGFQTRKNLKQGAGAQNQANTKAATQADTQAEANAATTIQAHIKGYQTRKQLKRRKDDV